MKFVNQNEDDFIIVNKLYYLSTHLINSISIAILVSAQVPGSIYTDLIRNNILEQDPYFGSNDLNYRWVSYDNWTFHKYFNGSYK